MIGIREGIASDVPSVRRLNEEAFGQSTEANIVNSLRSSCDRLLSLVAVLDKRIVGHILFSPVVLESEGREHNGMVLGPMAVVPSLQRQGIGSRLVGEGLARMRSADCPFVAVLGHHEYYPRFWFERASKYGVRPVGGSARRGVHDPCRRRGGHFRRGRSHPLSGRVQRGDLTGSRSGRVGKPVGVDRDLKSALLGIPSGADYWYTFTRPTIKSPMTFPIWNNCRCRLVFELDFHGNVLALAIFEVNLDFLSRS